MPEISSRLHTLLTLALIGASLLPVVWILAFYCRRVSMVTRAIRRQANRDTTAAQDQPQRPREWPGVSVVVYSAGEASALERMLPAILGQDYPGAMEIVVVNDGRNEAVKDCVTLLSNRHRNIYMTYTPGESRNLSRKKLSLTIGIKAAHHGIVVLTEERAQLPGIHWLRNMVAPMADDPSIEIVTGYAAPDHKADHRRGARYRSFDHAAEGVAYLSAALSGHPWRGTSFNLAYRKDLFFRNKGFGHSLNLQTGDDDIFVSEVATGINCAVEIAPGSQVEITAPDIRRYHHNERMARAFSTRHIARRPRMFFGLSSTMMWLWLILSAGAIAIGWPMWWSVAAVGGTACLLWIPVMITWHSALRALNARRLLLTVPGMLLRRPFTNLRYRRRAYRNRHQNYTWSAPS